MVLRAARTAAGALLLWLSRYWMGSGNPIQGEAALLMVIPTSAMTMVSLPMIIWGLYLVLDQLKKIRKAPKVREKIKKENAKIKTELEVYLRENAEFKVDIPSEREK